MVHGIFDHVPGATPGRAAEQRLAPLRPRFAEGLGRLGVAAPETAMAHYADLLRTDLPEQEQSAAAGADFESLDPAERAVAAEWLEAAGALAAADP